MLRASPVRATAEEGSILPVSRIGEEQKNGSVRQSSPDTISARSPYPASLAVVLSAVERQMIEDALLRTGTCIAAARDLEIGLRTLFYKMRALGIRTRTVLRIDEPA